MEGFLRGFF
uniref:Uncharacterized protein n=1 Tax=Arundo donax TaxID=35708 RepID=A0A0A9B631_ARUDO